MAIEKIIDLGSEHKEELVKLYVRVFAGAPWYEVLKCKSCGEAYGDPKDNFVKIAEIGKCIKNKKCEQPLQLVPFYTGEDNLGAKIYDDALQQKKFVGVAAVKDGTFVGFSWGYAVPEQDTPSVKFSEVRDLITHKLGVSPNNVFYAAETGTDSNCRKEGIGYCLTKSRLEKAKDKGFEGAIFRTINTGMVRIWEKIFGQQLNPAFDDPVKEAKWYYCKLEGLL